MSYLLACLGITTVSSADIGDTGVSMSSKKLDNSSSDRKVSGEMSTLRAASKSKNGSSVGTLASSPATSSGRNLFEGVDGSSAFLFLPGSKNQS
jgi:hypothetical protein